MKQLAGKEIDYPKELIIFKEKRGFESSFNLLVWHFNQYNPWWRKSLIHKYVYYLVANMTFPHFHSKLITRKERQEEENQR